MLIALVLLAGAVGQACAQDRTPAQLLGSVIVLLAVAEACELPATSEQRQALAVAGERLQARARISDAELTRLLDEIAQEARRADCTRARASFTGEIGALLAEVARVP